jgi:hypothetical protein
MAASFYRHHALRESSHSTYDSHVKSFLRYLQQEGRGPFDYVEQREATAAVFRWLGHERQEGGNRWNTLGVKKAAVRSFYLYHGHPDITDAFDIKAFLKGVKQVDGGSTPLKKQPFTCRHMEALRALVGGSREESAVWAAACLGFFFLLRVSNIAGKKPGEFDERYVLLRKNVRFFSGPRAVLLSKEALSCIDRIEIRVARSKNDLRPLVRCADRSGHPEICPVLAVARHLLATGDVPASWPVTALSGERSRGDRPAHLLLRDVLSKYLKRAGALLGEDPKDTGSHSLRIGGATELHNQGVEDSWIMEWGNWRSAAFLGYCRNLGEYPRRLASIMTAALRARSFPRRAKA